MTSKEKVKFITSFLKEVEKLDVCNSYRYLVDDLKDLLLNEENELGSNLKNAKNWATFIWEVEESLGSFIYDQEIIGYKNAHDFLVEFDPSLKIGLEEAENEDWTLSTLGSEILAGLALRSILRDAIYDILRALKKEETNNFIIKKLKMKNKQLKERIITSKICYDEGIAEKGEWFNFYGYTKTGDRDEVYSNIFVWFEDHRDGAKIDQGINIKELKLSIKMLNFVNYNKIQVKFYHNYKNYDYLGEEDDSFDISKKDLIKILEEIINEEQKQTI